MTQEPMQEQIMARAMKDPSFRQELLSNPRGVLAKEYHVHLPAHIAVRVLEEAPTTFTLVLPAREEVALELTYDELRGVNGGGDCGENSLCCQPPPARRQQ